MTIKTTRFGELEVDPKDLLVFSEGLIGFHSLRHFVILDDPKDEIFAWLQNCEEPGIAFPILEPELFTSEYSVALSKMDLEALQVTGREQVRYFSVITIPDNPREMTANLKAPVVINLVHRLGRQIVLQDNNLSIREPFFQELKKRIVQNPSASMKAHVSDWDLLVKVPAPKGDSNPPEADL